MNAAEPSAAPSLLEQWLADELVLGAPEDRRDACEAAARLGGVGGRALLEGVAQDDPEPSVRAVAAQLHERGRPATGDAGDAGAQRAL